MSREAPPFIPYQAQASEPGISSYSTVSPCRFNVHSSASTELAELQCSYSSYAGLVGGLPQLFTFDHSSAYQAGLAYPLSYCGEAPSPFVDIQSCAAGTPYGTVSSGLSCGFVTSKEGVLHHGEEDAAGTGASSPPWVHTGAGRLPVCPSGIGVEVPYPAAWVQASVVAFQGEQQASSFSTGSGGDSLGATVTSSSQASARLAPADDRLASTSSRRRKRCFLG